MFQKKYIVLLAILLLITIIALPALNSQNNAEVRSNTTPDSIADSLLSSMTLEEKIGQLFMVRSFGNFQNVKDPSVQRLDRLITNYHIGGIIFFQGDVYGQAALHNHYQSVAKIPLWIAQDMEFGAAMRINGTTRFTPAMGIAATGNPNNAYIKGKVTAAEAKALKVNQVYAPVLDVNNNPDNPVINVRSFSSDPYEVSEYALWFMEGVDSEGLLATGKHFPGHGDTDTDSHLALPTIVHDYSRLDSLELVPFRETINNGLKSVMSAHISFPEVSEFKGLPGTMDPSILHRILVDSLSFDGLIVTDGLEMRGIAEHFSPGDAVIESLLAGADMMLLSPDEMTAIDELKKAVESGRVSEERVNQSVRKILILKAEHGTFEDPFIDIEQLKNDINKPEYQEDANRIARESVTVLRDRSKVLPIREYQTNNILLISLADGDGHSSGSTLAREFRRYHPNITYRELNNRTTNAEINELLNLANRSSLVVIGSFINVRSFQPIQIPQKQLRVLKRIENATVPSMLIAFGNPYVIRDLPDVDSHVIAWSTHPNQIRHTIPSLFGGSAITGTFPGEIPGLYNRGDGLTYQQSTIRFDTPESAEMITDSLLNIDLIMQHAINDSVFPGGVVGVMRKGSLIWHEGYGYHDYTKTKKITANTVFDLASVTKVMATTTSIMKLAGEGKLSVDDPVSKYIPEWDTNDKNEITIRQLLLHTSGLPAFRIYVDTLKTRDEIVRAVRNEPLINTPGETYVYSDLGFILLGEIVYEISKKHLDRFVMDEIFKPMGMNDTWFNPDNAGTRVSSRIPPTEIDTVFNRGTVIGKVHDERAYFMDGVAGHAGLFSSAKDISAYAYMLLNDGMYAGENILSPQVISLFSSHQSPLNHRGLGFDRKSDGFSSAGELTGRNTYGHLGFTGTSVWLDPEEEIAIILLTNRTYPHRSYGSDISRIRAKIADAVMKSIAN